ncbi:uncharacterized protein UV8b_00416 [Ustilaginoidea virens]|uniref:Uncharacterized protein n=1 Tax=Ustilaginoidea virens TaxID=1159556 RepID=A0A063BVT0_USTVR|nr:uncharacterized protein UV8b_00416 [Ustilaginoidea virens]QUC16175.1 hypothetical protein UV8b_00416 [Ustilaginoidea virens]GAO19487.1 hypothetical protein UVI_02027230 [Ustilaginoidea virens]
MALNNINNLHVHVQVDDDAPPPPYSETDIYSNSGASHTPTTNTTLASPRAGLAPLDDAASRDSSSTSGDVIYTPPLTPRTPSTTSHSRPAQLHLRQPQPESGPGLTGAALYFDSRPAPAPTGAPPRETLFHTVTVEDTSLPEHFLYQNEWAARDVTPQDWATFVNFLLPSHIFKENEAVIERKLREEGGSDAASTSGRSQAEAQLDHLRENPAATTRSRQEIEATIHQWNDGFFGPRGISLSLDPAGGSVRMPGGWDAGLEQRLHQHQHEQRQQDSKAGLGAESGPSNRAGPSWSFGGGSGWNRHGRGHGDGRGGHHDPHDHARQHQVDRQTDGRGRKSSQGDEKYQRSGSVSSVSSASSSSSESSIGSLPDYDQVKDHQLPLYAERLRDWTSRPEQVRTKNDVDDLKLELKRTKDASKDMPAACGLDKKALKAQIKTLQAQWKAIKKSQRQTRKARKRERRQRRRAQKREKRQQKREMKKAYRDAKRSHGPSGTHFPPAPPLAPMPLMPPMPPMLPAAAMPPAPPAPPLPPMPTAGPVPPCWNQSLPPGPGGPSQRGMFFAGPDGPLGQRGGPFGSRGPPGEQGPPGLRGLFGGRGFGRGNGGRGGGPWGGRGGPFGGPRGGPFGASRGRGRGRGKGSPRDAPGAWPEEADGERGQEAGVTLAPPCAPPCAPPPRPAPGAASLAKYEAADRIKEEIAELSSKGADLKAGAEKRATEKQIEALTEKLEAARMEADEAYAKEMAAKDAGHY